MPDLDQDSLRVLVLTMKLIKNIMVRYFFLDLHIIFNNLCEVTFYLSMLIYRHVKQFLIIIDFYPRGRLVTT